MSTALRAEFYFDGEADNWHFRVPALHINGGGTPSREDAERECLAAVAFAWRGILTSTTATRRRSPWKSQSSRRPDL